MTPESPATEQTFTKVCRRCSVQSDTAGSFCPNCGTSFEGNSRLKRNKWVGATLAVVLVVAGVAGLGMKLRHDQQVKVAAAAQQRGQKAATQAEEAKKQQAAAAAQSAQEAKDAADQAARDQRGSLIKAMQKSITKDAKKSVSDGILVGPILYTQCTPLGGGSTDDLTAITGTFSCLAANKENGDGTISGYSFSATANWDEDSYTWHLGN